MGSFLLNPYIFNVNAKTSFAWKTGPLSSPALYTNIWDKGFNYGPALDATPSDGIIVNESGWYYVEYMQRSTGSNNGYIGLGINGSRTALETRTNGMWTHDHSYYNGTFAHSKYVGWLNAGEKITAGHPATNYTSYMQFGNNSDIGVFYVIKLNMKDGDFFSQDFFDYAWKDGANSWVSAYKTRYNYGGGNGTSLSGIENTDGIVVKKDGYYWIEAAHRRTTSGTANIKISINGDITKLQNNSDYLWTSDDALVSNQHAHAFCIGFFKEGDIICAGSIDSAGELYATDATGYTAFLKAIRIDNENSILSTRNMIEFGYKEGPASYSSVYKCNWNLGYHVGSSINATSNNQGLIINNAGDYLLEYHHRSASTSYNVYGCVGVNGDRSVIENRNSGMWTHDHAQGIGQHIHSRYLGPMNVNEFVTGGPYSSYSSSSYFQFHTEGYTGVLLALRMK